MIGRGFRWALTLGLILTAPTVAQRMQQHRYDAANEITIRGAIVSVNELECAVCGAGTGTHLTVRTEGEEMEVLLGPTTYLSKQELTLAAGDEIEVVGSKVKMGEKEQLVAREVKKGEATLTLRNKNGRPKWAGRGWGGR
jgi:hypothetical protein